MWFASLRGAEQRLEDAIAFYHKSQQLDPLGRIPLSNLPTLYAQLGQNEVALKLWVDAIEIHPEWPTPYRYIAIHLLGMGRLDEAMAWSRAAQSLSTDPGLAGNIDLGIYLQFGEFEKASAGLRALPADHPIAPFIEGFERLFDGDYPAALELFSNSIDSADQQQQRIGLGPATDTAILAGDLSKARQYTLMREPLLNTDGPLPIDRLTVRNIVKLAYIERMNGDLDRAGQLLNESLAVVRGMPRLGMFGHGILDVQIYALLNRREDAFLALNEAVDAGFRSSIFFDNWFLDSDPYLEQMRSDPRFAEILRKLNDLNEVMHQRVIAAEESGNWDQLTALVMGE